MPVGITNAEQSSFGDRLQPPACRALAAGGGWTLSEYLCHAGPADRPFEERHESFSIAAVVAGTFNYRTTTGRAFLHSGAFLLGNHGACFECGHEHSRGDRCVSLHLTPEYFGELAAIAAGSSRFEFPIAKLPPVLRMLPLTAGLEARAETGDRLRLEEAVVRFASAILGTVSGHRASQDTPQPRDAKRVGRALNYIEERMGEVVSLDELSGVAAMSKYHFLRTFRRLVGVTPYQFVLSARMRAAAARLARSGEPVSSVAYEAGFGDLSTFNRRFRQLFGASPGHYRRQVGVPGS
jgi:AraC-like DNA-binding protein